MVWTSWIGAEILCRKIGPRCSLVEALRWGDLWISDMSRLILTFRVVKARDSEDILASCEVDVLKEPAKVGRLIMDGGVGGGGQLA